MLKPILTPGQRGTYAGFPATVLRHYHEGLYEIRVPGGVTCVDASEFLPDHALEEPHP